MEFSNFGVRVRAMAVVGAIIMLIISIADGLFQTRFISKFFSLSHDSPLLLNFGMWLLLWFISGYLIRSPLINTQTELSVNTLYIVFGGLLLIGLALILVWLLKP